MRIGVDARPLAWYGGVRTVAHGLVSALASSDLRNEYFLYSDIDFPCDMEPTRWHRRVVPRLFRLPGFGLTWPFLDGARSARSDHLDGYLGLASVLPGFMGKFVRRVTFVHDVTWRICPELMRRRARWTMRTLVENSIRRADRVIVTTEMSAEQLRVTLKVPQAKISVAALGVDSRFFRPAGGSACRSRMEARYGIRNRYILAVGSVNPRKNITTLLKAYDLLLRQGLQGLQLVIAGIAEWGGSQIADTMHALGLTGRDVQFLGHIPDEDLPFLYGGAEVFVFPSLFEGFGLPLLEAMSCGTPAVASDNYSFPEVGGDAVLYVPPRSAEGFASAIRQLLERPALRQAMAEKGLERVKDFTWENTAQGVLKAIEQE